MDIPPILAAENDAGTYPILCIYVSIWKATMQAPLATAGHQLGLCQTSHQAAHALKHAPDDPGTPNPKPATIANAL